MPQVPPSEKTTLLADGAADAALADDDKPQSMPTMPFPCPLCLHLCHLPTVAQSLQPTHIL
eukprot:7377551-Prymnesium_polylepis.1